MGVLCDGDMSPSELGTVPDAVELTAGDGAARHPSREQSRNTVAKATTRPILTVHEIKVCYSLALIITKCLDWVYKLVCMCQV